MPMPFHTLDIPCKTAAGHTVLASDEPSLSKEQLRLLRLVDGRRGIDDILAASTHPHSVRHTLAALRDQGLLVNAACVCLPGETPAPIAAPQRARRLLMQTLINRTPWMGAFTLLRLRHVHDIEGLRRLLPAVRNCLDQARVNDCDRLLNEVEGLLTPH